MNLGSPTNVAGYSVLLYHCELWCIGRGVVLSHFHATVRRPKCSARTNLNLFAYSFWWLRASSKCGTSVHVYQPLRRTCCLHLHGKTMALPSRRPRQSEPPKRRFVTTETRDVTFQKSSSMALCCVFFILRACHLSHLTHPSRTSHLIGICSRLCVRKFPLHHVSPPSSYVISFEPK